jgi:hypothetical protein
LYLHCLFNRPSNGGGSKKPTANGSSSGGGAAKPTATNSGSGGKPANVPAAAGGALSGNEAAAPLGAAENFGFPPNFGRAGEDFPIYGPHNMPATTFSCEGKVKGGYDLRSFFAFLFLLWA